MVESKISFTSPYTQNLLSSFSLFCDVGLYLALSELGAGGGKTKFTTGWHVLQVAPVLPWGVDSILSPFENEVTWNFDLQGCVMCILVYVCGF